MLNSSIMVRSDRAGFAGLDVAVECRGNSGRLRETLDRRFPSLYDATSFGVLVPDFDRQNLFYSTLYSRWLADLKLVECALVLPVEIRQAEWLHDYRDFLLVAPGHGETLARTLRSQASVRRFLCRIRTSHDHDIDDFIRKHPITGIRETDGGKVVNVLSLFRSIPRARSLTEGLGFSIVRVPAGD